MKLRVSETLCFYVTMLMLYGEFLRILDATCESSYHTVPSFLIQKYSSTSSSISIDDDDDQHRSNSIDGQQNEVDVLEDNRLLLTPFLERNYLNAALDLAELRYTTDNKSSRRRNQDEENTNESYSGYLTVDEKYSSNLYFWFFPSLDNSSYAAPLILWLQGGPGVSSLYGLFEEIGPFRCLPDSQNRCTLIENPYTWNENNSMLFIDSPVGTGFSFTENEDGYATNLKTVSQHLYKALLQFFQLFPEYRLSDFFIAGESFAGKFVPSLASYIHEKNNRYEKINLKGIIVGSGFTDPPTMLVYSEYLYQLALIDEIAKRNVQKLEKRVRNALKNSEYMDAYRIWNNIMDTFMMESKYNSVYHALNDQTGNWNKRGGYLDLVQSPQMRKMLHVGNADFCNLGGIVYDKLLPEFMTSVRSELKTVISNYRVLYYNGQFDVISPYVATVNLFDKLNFDGKALYKKARRTPWYVNNALAGYVKSNGNLTVALVRNAGHMVPKDQPEWTFNLISSFVRNRI